MLKIFEKLELALFRLPNNDEKLPCILYRSLSNKYAFKSHHLLIPWGRHPLIYFFYKDKTPPPQLLLLEYHYLCNDIIMMMIKCPDLNTWKPINNSNYFL